MGSIFEPFYIQNHVTANRVIKRLLCNFRSVLQHLVCLVSDGILKTYETIMKERRAVSSHCPLNQQRALQLLFDIKFVLFIIPRKDDCRVSDYFSAYTAN